MAFFSMTVLLSYSVSGLSYAGLMTMHPPADSLGYRGWEEPLVKVLTRRQCFQGLRLPVQGQPEVESTFHFPAALCARQVIDYCLFYLTFQYILQAIFFPSA